VFNSLRLGALNESARLAVVLSIIDLRLKSCRDKFDGLAALRSLETTNEFIFASVPLFTDVKFSVSTR